MGIYINMDIKMPDKCASCYFFEWQKYGDMQAEHDIPHCTLNVIPLNDEWPNDGKWIEEVHQNCPLIDIDNYGDNAARLVIRGGYNINGRD